MSSAFTNAKNTMFAISNNIAFGNKIINGIDSITIDNKILVISLDGIIYNIQELKDNLERNNINTDNINTNQILLYLYSIYNYSFLDYIDGNFALSIYDEKENLLLIARDRLGIKPIFFTMEKYIKRDSTFSSSVISDANYLFAFSSEINSLLKLECIDKKLGKEELLELFALGPAHTPHKTYFKGIYNLEAGHFGVFKDNTYSDFCYWDLKDKTINDNLSTIINNSKNIVTDSLNRDLTDLDSNKVCTMLSGGLDSSILSTLAKNKLNNLSTFSIDFVGNDEDFKPGNYQPSKDSDFVKIMTNHLQSEHKTIYVTHEELFKSLHEAMCLRGFPGMADIDSSMLVFTKKIKSLGFDVAISGECADEIFGGYPWYYKSDLATKDSFPFARSVAERANILNKDLVSEDDVKQYIKNQYYSTFKDFKSTSNDIFELNFKKTCYLTVKWFMNTLIERTERMTLASDVDVRTPFANYKLFEYIYNVSAKQKLGLINGLTIPTEKYILRKAFENILPNEIITRKKSPFPKTYDEKYLKLLEEEIKEIIRSSTAPLLQIIDVKYLIEMIYDKGKNIKENWFGQLMTYPETLAYLIQVNMWLKEYNVEIDI